MKFTIASVALGLAASCASAYQPQQPQQQVDRRGFFAKGAAGAAFAVGSGMMQPSAAQAFDFGGSIKFGDESIMVQKAHGTSEQPVQSDLLYGVSNKLADRICNYNRHFAEMGGYFRSTAFEDIVLEAKGPITFYDSVTGKALFVAPINRSPEEFVKESQVHGWPSFRDSEVVWENVRVLKSSGETVSVDGTHLGHNLPDRRGNRYCINLVSIAGQPNIA
mmetsp:Transcript_16215/g.44932  ORF Transcript_16215/g.44932 Transcript_16215/m.44932 type:complete len:220 (-) Transcript_16215:674-1333(-)